MKQLFTVLRKQGVTSLARVVWRSFTRDGFRVTWNKIRTQMARHSEDARSTYERNRKAQHDYVRNYARMPSKARRRMLEDLLDAERGHRGIVLYPASYNLEMRQRPEHILRCLAAQGYLCLMMKVGCDTPFIRRQAERLYYTNMYEDVLCYLKQTPVILYLTFPGLHYATRLLESAYVIYDVLDRLDIFATYCPSMAEDHQALLRDSDLVLCSAPPLYEASVGTARRCVLVPNGVSREDFAPTRRPPPTPPVVVGYYGAITEFLDFDLLEAIADLPGFALAMAGPISAFRPEHKGEVEFRTDALFARKNVRHHGVLAYPELREFLHGVHCAIVPFVVRPETDAVSPLKVFEYMAADKPVLATPTQNMKDLDGAIFVGDQAAITRRLRDGSWQEIDRPRRDEVLARHAWSELLRPVLAELELVDILHARPPATALAPPRIDIVNISFFDWNGATIYKGGAERYVYDLASLCQRLGCTVRILQNANQPFTRQFRGVDVLGVPLTRSPDMVAMSKGFARETKEADLVIASPLELASRFYVTRQIIGINHGVHWDTRVNEFDTFALNRFRVAFDALQRMDACVCVDTNFINWVRGIEWRLAQQLEYVPNYVDPAQFRPVPKQFDSRRVVVLYPRRLYDPRGINETLEAFEFLLPHHDGLELHLCGQADGADADRARRAVAAHGGRIAWYELEMDQMHQAYATSQIVLVPTMYAEGTSLSCIEAMATNNAVIATNVGGLPNLVSDGYSGLLIRPDTWEIVAAVKKLLADRDLAARLARNALAVAETLSKARWEQRWVQVLESVLRRPLGARPAPARVETNGVVTPLRTLAI